MNIESPLVSFCLLTYNQEKYVEDAINGALNQRYSPLQIIISDDCSTDGTIDIINKVVGNYKGEHHIHLNFNDSNLGLASHFNKVMMDLATGEFIIIAAGDDISYPDRTLKSVQFLQNNSDCLIADFGVDYIDESGTIILRKVKQGDSSFTIDDFLSGKINGTMGCSRIYSRKLFDLFGNLAPSCPTEDSTSVFRGVLMGRISCLQEKVLSYRIHTSSISSPENFIKLRTWDILNQYLKDAEVAHRMKLISNQQYQKIIRKLKFNAYKREILRWKKAIVFLGKKNIKRFKG